MRTKRTLRSASKFEKAMESRPLIAEPVGRKETPMEDRSSHLMSLGTLGGRSGRPLRILFLNHNYEKFGTFYRCFFLARSLARIGHHVDLVCASRKRFDLLIRNKMIEDRFRIITLPRIRLQQYHTGHSLRALINSGIVLLKNYDILQSFAVAQPATAVPTVVARYLTNKPIVVDWDDAWGEGLAHSHPSIVGRTLTYLEEEVPKLANTVTVVSEYLRGRAASSGYRRIVKIPNGANVDEIRPGDKREARGRLGIPAGLKMLVAVGHTFLKSMDNMLSAFHVAMKMVPDVKLFVVGNFNKDPGSIKKKYGEENLVFAGEQPFETVKLYLAAADGLVLPMEDTVFERARFPIRLGDYMAAARPIVSNAVGEVKHVLERNECGLTCPPDDIEGFAEIMTAAIQDGEVSDRLGRNARICAETQYNWNNIASDLAVEYGELVGARG